MLDGSVWAGGHGIERQIVNEQLANEQAINEPGSVDAPNISTASNESAADVARELDAVRAQLAREHEAARVVSDYYSQVLSKTTSAAETLRAGCEMVRGYLVGRDAADLDRQAWAWILEPAFGLPRGWSTPGGDGEAAALARETFENNLASTTIVVPDADTLFVVPLPDATGRHAAIGLIAVPVLSDIDLDEAVASIATTIGVTTMRQMDHTARVVHASRSLQYAQAAARAQRRLVEPTDLNRALWIAVEALESCEDLVGGTARLLKDGAREEVASFGDVDAPVDEIDVEISAPEEQPTQRRGRVLLPVIIDDGIEAEIELQSRSAIETVEDETLSSIASAVTGAVARHRAAYTIESLRRSTTRRLVEAQERERSMVAADIHDGVLQQLGATAIRLELAQARVEQRDFDTASEIISDGADEIRFCARELRSLLMELRPQVLDDNGLNSALIELGRHVEDVEVTVSSDVPDDLGNEFSITIFRIVQEALTNIQKHAHAKSARVDVSLRDNQIAIEIVDDGIGFEGAVTGPSAEGSHLGLLGMRERARMFGGNFSIAGSSGGGTEIHATLPLDGLMDDEML